MNAIIRSMIEDHGIRQSEADLRMVGWDVIPIVSGEIVVGHIAKQRSEIHSALFPEYRGKTSKAMLRAILMAYRKLLDDCVFLTTKIPVDNDTDVKITENIGFREVRRDDGYRYYWMDSTTILGGKKCNTQKSI